MRHYVAVQAADGKWFYANEGYHRDTGLPGWTKAGACFGRITCPDCEALGPGAYGTAEQRACKTCGGKYSIPDPNACQGHDSAEEAYAHEKARKLKQAQFLPDEDRPRTLHRCDAPDCEAMTSGRVYIGSYFRKHLCADHRNVETVAPLYHCGESWES